MNAIETKYNGYRFRSRTEARWAVFLDNMGIKYEYEKEGFNLPNGYRYLPDFWLDDWYCWLEIKNEMFVSSSDITKIRLLSGGRGASCRDVLLVNGTPYRYELRRFFNGFEEPVFSHRFASCAECGSSDLLITRKENDDSEVIHAGCYCEYSESEDEFNKRVNLGVVKFSKATREAQEFRAEGKW